MAEPRPLATKCKIGPLEFWALAASGGGERQTIVQRALGRDGGPTDDTGEDARRETIRAELTEVEYLKLDNLRREAKVVTIVHPLFGAFPGRVKRCNYEADSRDMVDATILVEEDGDHTAQLAPSVMSLPAAQQQFDGAFDAFEEAVDLSEGLGLDSSLLDITDPLSDLVDECGVFSGLLDDALEGAAGVLDLAGGVDALVDKAGDFITGLESDVIGAVEGAAGLVDYALDDLAYGVVSAAQQCVEAAQGTMGDAWHTFKTLGPTSLDRVLYDWLGSDDEDTQARVLAANPHILDVLCVDAQVEIRLPVGV